MSNHRRFFIDTALQVGIQLELTGDLARQITHVLRLTSGDKIVLLDGKGAVYPTVIEAVKQSSVCVNIYSVEHPSTEQPIQVRIIIGRPKSTKIELILQKCTELGASSFAIMECTRSVGSPPDSKRLLRWQKIVTEAVEQCGGSVIPEITGMDINEACNLISSADLALLAQEHGTETPIYKALHQKQLDWNIQGEKKRQITLITGPEGGFCNDEAQKIIASGAMPVSLGKRILRAETAAIAACVCAVLFPWSIK